MKKIVQSTVITFSLIICFASVMHAKLKPDPKWDQRKEHRVTIINKTDKPISVSIFKPHETETIGYFDLGIDAQQTKEVTMSELYWFEKKGLGFGKNVGPAEVLMHGWPTQVTIKTGNLEAETEALYPGPYNQIQVSIDENDELQIDHPKV